MSITKVLAGVGISVTVAAAAGVYGGVYNIGADAPHWAVTRSMIDIFRERSIVVRSARIVAPPLDAPAMIAEGAEHYRAMCVDCHLAPGESNTEMREGLYPLPQNLAELSHKEHEVNDSKREAARQFWIIKHGIKMTSMPAAGKTHNDETIWGLVAFVRKLPTMTAEEYQRMNETSGMEPHPHAGSESEHDEHDHHGGVDELKNSAHEPIVSETPAHHHESIEPIPQ